MSQKQQQRNKDNKKYYSGAEKATAKYRHWTSIEDSKILAKEVSDKFLSESLGRSIKAIEVRRCRLLK